MAFQSGLKLKNGLVGGVLWLLGACSPLSLLNATIPTSELVQVQDVAYGSLPRQKLDIYQPKSARQPLPVIVFFYGGGWDSGEKGDYLFAAEALAEKGFLVVVPDYRIYPEVQFPAFLDDCARAVAWTLAHIADYGGDPSRLFLMGHSAGAYNAVMLALDEDYLKAAGATPADIQGVVALSGPYDFLPLTSDRLRQIFSAEDMAETQPVTFARGDAPPMLLLAGTADETVRPANTERLARKIAAKGGQADMKLYDGLGHAGAVLALTALFEGKAPVLKDSITFLDNRLKEISR